MMKYFLVVLLALYSCVLIAQDEGIHYRDFERAHPTADPKQLREKEFLVPFVQGAPFPSLFTNSNMIVPETDAQPMQNESSIAISPLNPKILIGSAVDYRENSSTWVYYSADGGVTWKNTSLGKARPGWASSNDPSVCFDHEGRGYLCYGGFNRQGQAQFGENGVFVSITTDGGITWAQKHIAVIIHTGTQTADSAFEDKYYVHADTTFGSPFRGRLYIPWKRVINRDSSTQIVIARSTDKGTTWLNPVAVSDRFPHTSEDTTFGQSFPLARTGPDGSVHLVWNSGTESSVRYARSTDGGQQWTSPQIIHTYKPFGEKSLVAGQVNSRVKKIVRAEAYPTLSIDNTEGPRRGWLYLCWSADNYPNIYFSRSTDNGSTWSPAKVLHADTTNDQFWPWISLDPLNGDLAVMYADSRDDAKNILVNTYVSYSSDGGTTWVDRRVGDAENDLRRNPFQGNTFAGDYSGCDFRDGKVYPSWVDMRNTTLSNLSDNDVYTALINVRAPEAPLQFNASTLATNKTAIALDWTAVNKRSYGQPLDTSGARFVLFREGVFIAEFPMSVLNHTDVGLEEFKEYHYQLLVASGADSSSRRNASAFAGGSKEPGVPQLTALRGSTNDSLYATVVIPTRRLDGVTALTNLHSIRLVTNKSAFNVNVAASDTGKTITFGIQERADGWYGLKAACVDSSSNVSPFSDSLIAFTGRMDWQTENFDTLPNFYVQSGRWGRANNFAFSAPSSYTETPDSLYKSSQRDTVYLYPFHSDGVIPEYDAFVLSWRVAAFVDPGDTAFLEMKKGYGLDGDWKVVQWWNSSLEERWQDTTKGDDAWRFGSVPVPAMEAWVDTVMIRLRFRSNVIRHSDGFYIDNLQWDHTTAVHEELSIVRSVFPQPATSHAVLELQSEHEVISCSILDVNGRLMTSSWYQSGRTVVVNLRDVPSGLYSMIVNTGGSVDHAMLQVVK